MFQKVFLVVAVAIISDQGHNVLSQETTDNTTLSSGDKQCNPGSVEHLHFRIVVGVVKWPENETAPQNVTAPAWAKIILRVHPPESSHVNGTPPCEAFFNTLDINARGANIDWENVTLTHLQTGKRIRITQILPLHKNSDNGDLNYKEKFTIQAAEPLLFDDLLEIQIPYQLTLTQGSNEYQWQGLYFYNPTSLNLSSWDRYSYFPYRTPYLFPTLGQIGPDNSNSFQWPGQRATFKISVARPDNLDYVAISNMDVVETVQIAGLEAGWVRDHFRQSPPLPLDQVAVMILHGFENYTVVDETGEDRVTLWSNRHIPYEDHPKNDSYYTVTAILKLVSDLENMLNGTKLPVEKLDVVVVPWDTSDSWHHSNLGLVIASEGNIILGENALNTHPQSFLLRQVGFQWLGGMVSIMCTPEAVKDGFYCIDQRNGLLQYMVKSLDQGVNKRAFFSVESSILEMIEDVFSRPVMESAVANFYLPKMKWKQATPQDFYDALQEAIVYHNLTNRIPYAGATKDQFVSVGEIVASWHHHKYRSPRIYVAQVENDTRAILVSQRDLSQDPTGELWWVPLKIATDAGEDLVWLAPNVTPNHSTNATYIWSKKDVIDTTKWLVINPDGTGYYSVEYSEPLWKNIIAQLTLNHTVIGEAARNYLVHNQFTVSPVTHHWGEMKKALEITQYLSKERSAKVWGNVPWGIDGFYRTFSKKAGAIGPLQDYFGSLINPVLLDIGVSPQPGERKDAKILREKLMENCGMLRIPACTLYARGLMSAWMENPQQDPFCSLNVSYQVQKELYCAALQGEESDGDTNLPSSSAAFQFMVSQLVAIDNPNIMYGKCDLWGSALWCAPDDQLLVNLFNNTAVIHKSALVTSCFAETIAHDVASKKPITMIPVIFEFWTREVVGGTMLPASFMRMLWAITGSGYLPPGMGDKMREFLEKNEGLFKDDLVENVANFKYNFAFFEKQDTYSLGFWKNVGDNMVQWFKDNLNKSWNSQ